MFSLKDIPNFLKSHTIFSSLSSSEISKLSLLFKVNRYNQNELLSIEGEQAKNFLIIAEGTVRCFNITGNGDKKTYFILQEGTIIFSAFITGMPYTYNAEAITSVTVVSIDQEDFNKHISTNNTIMQSLLKESTNFFSKEINDIKLCTGLEAKERLIYYLLKNYILNQKFTITGTQNINIELEIDKATLASNLDITPETLSRTLNKLANIGIISNKKNITCSAITLQKCCNLLLQTSYRNLTCPQCILKKVTKNSCNNPMITNLNKSSYMLTVILYCLPFI